MFRKPVAVHSKKDLGRSASQNIIKAGAAGMLAEDWKVPVLIELSVPRPEVVSSVYLEKSDNEPVAFKLTSSPTLYPALYSIWSGHLLSRCVYVNSFVSGFVLGGAHVMLPGVIRGSHMSIELFNKGDIVSVYVVGNNHAIAVGIAEMSSAEIKMSPPDGKGKAVQVLHYFGDYLWQMGSKKIPDGFSFERVVAVERPLSPEVVIPSEEAALPIVSQPIPEMSLTCEEVDKLLFVSFLEAVSSLDVGRDFPMESSSLFSRMQLASKRILTEASKTFLSKHNLPRITEICIDRSEWSSFKLELKQSWYKQMKNFLIFLSEQGLLKHKLGLVLSVNTQHTLMKEYRPLPERTNSTGKNSARMVQVSQLFGVNKLWASVLGIPSSSLSAHPDMINKLNVWMKDSLQTGPNIIPIDPSKLDQIRKLFSNPETVSKKDFSNKFLNGLVPHYSLSTELPPRVRKGSPPVVGITVKKIQNKKFITEISNLDKYFLPQDLIAKNLSKELAGACSNTEASLIHCQGSVAEEVKKILSNSVGVPNNCIIVKC